MSIRPPSRRNDRPGLLARGAYRPLRRFKVVLHKAADKDLMFVARVVMEESEDVLAGAAENGGGSPAATAATIDAEVEGETGEEPEDE